MPQFSFGSGTLYGVATADANGNAIATTSQTPVKFGTLNEVTIDVSYETKMLYGQYQFPVAVGRGKGKISGKAKFAQLSGSLINSLFFGQTLTSGIVAVNIDYTGTTVAASVTPTVPNSGTWAEDLGVRDSNGVPMVRGATASAAGIYAVAAGVYSFHTSDIGKQVFIDFGYTATSTTAKTSTVSNLLMGAAPTFKAVFAGPFQGKQLKMTINNAIASKLGFSTKLDDFNVPEFDFEGFADGAGNVYTYSLSDF